MDCLIQGYDKAYLLDGVDLVGGSDVDGPGDGNLVGLGDVLVNNDLTGNGPGDGDGDINVVLVDDDLGDDVGDLGGDSGVGPHGGGDPGLSDGVSGGGASGDRGGGDGSIGGGGGGDSGGSNGAGLNKVLGSSSDIGGGGLRDGLMSSNSVLVTSHNGDRSGLDSPLTNNSVLHSVLHHGGAGGVAGMGLANHSGGVSHGGGDQSSSMGVTHSSDIGVASGGHDARGSAHSAGHEGESNLEKSLDKNQTLDNEAWISPLTLQCTDIFSCLLFHHLPQICSCFCSPVQK